MSLQAFSSLHLKPPPVSKYPVPKPLPHFIFVIAASPLLSANFCLSQFVLLKQRIIVQVVYKQQKLISHSSEGWRSEVRVPAQSQPWGTDFSLYPHRTGQQSLPYC